MNGNLMVLTVCSHFL